MDDSEPEYELMELDDELSEELELLFELLLDELLEFELKLLLEMLFDELLDVE